MNLDRLTLLSQTAQLGSFAAVARRRGIDPSIVSRQIGLLEDEIGVRLFERTTRRLALTEAGTLLVNRLSAPLDELDQIFAEARDLNQKPSGRLRLATSSAFGERWLIPKLSEFRASYPLIQLEILLQDERMDPLAQGVDLSLRLGPDPDINLPCQRLMDVRYHIVASPNHIPELETPDQIGDHPIIAFNLPDHGTSWNLRSASGHIRTLRVQPALTISSALGIRQAALKGLGIAMLADWTIGDDLANGDLVDLLPNHEASAGNFDSAVWMIRSQSAYLPTKTRAMVDYLSAMAET